MPQDNKDAHPSANYKMVREDIYRSLFENVHDGIYQSTIDGRILTANPALVKMLGYDSEEELKKLNIGTDIYVKSVAREKYVRELERTGRLRDVELVLKKKDGSEIIVLENSHAVMGEDGNILYYEGTLTEITERKHAEEALRESENRYHTLIETLHDGLSLFDLEGKILYFNQHKKNMLGYDDDAELAGVNTFQMIHPDDMAELAEIHRELMKTGSIRNRELRVVRKDKSWFWADFSATLLRDKSDNPAYIMDTMRDITERKQAEEQLKLLKKSVDSHYDSAYWMDTDNKFVYVNDAGCEATGYDRSEIIGAHITLINPSADEKTMNMIWEHLRKKGSGRGESVHRRKDGTTFPVEIVSSYINFGGREYNCGFARDITERKKFLEEITRAKEEAEESDRLKTVFLHNISHEIRTPMNAIVGFTSLLEASDLYEERRRQYTDIVFQSSSHLLSIISDIVDISNIETGHVRLSENEFNINTVFDTLYKQYSIRADKADILMKYKTGLKANEAIIIADETKLLQIISNLLDNAYKFTSKGRIDFGYSVNGIKELLFYVKDTGIGISPEYVSKVFDRFYQIDNSSDRKTEGTGLGLSICKSYVELMGGRIWGKSEPGKGSEFYFTLPLKKPKKNKN
jgi:PAS domain S-box-containing protein